MDELSVKERCEVAMLTWKPIVCDERVSEVERLPQGAVRMNGQLDRSWELRSSRWRWRIDQEQESTINWMLTAVYLDELSLKW